MARSAGSRVFFSQAYSTSLTVAVAGMEGGGNKWHVHDFPVPSSSACGDTGGHFDPAQSVPEWGDLSAKWGLLSGATGSFAGTGQGHVLDPTLPLYGKHSVLGRSIVVHHNDASARACRKWRGAGRGPPRAAA